MNGGKSWMLITAPITLILSLMVAIPLLFSDTCNPATTSPPSSASPNSPSSPASPARTGAEGTGDGAVVDPASGSAVPAVGRWKGGQLANAAAIITAGKKAGVNQRGQTIAVMTAMANPASKSSTMAMRLVRTAGACFNSAPAGEHKLSG